jgi:hypothetical protein
MLAASFCLHQLIFHLTMKLYLPFFSGCIFSVCTIRIYFDAVDTILLSPPW